MESAAKKTKGKARSAKTSSVAKKIAKTAKELPVRARVAGKRRIVAVDSYNPEKLAEQNAEAKDAAKKAAKKSKRAPTKGTTARTKTTAKRSKA